MVRFGVPSERITALQNSVDTNELRRAVINLTPEAVIAERERHGISAAAPVGLFCGTLEPVKGLTMLLEAAPLIRKKVTGFELLIAGAGQGESLLNRAAEKHRWIHYIGPVFGDQKALAFRMADALLMPGRCGLVILDAFACGLPLISVNLPHHGPEMEYLDPGINGLYLPNSVSEYSDGVVRLFQDQAKLSTLKAGAMASGAKFTIEAMAENFYNGIVNCLASN
jgi:glycosyltransferase involved in cell wall biosynthesis